MVLPLRKPARQASNRCLFRAGRARPRVIGGDGDGDGAGGGRGGERAYTVKYSYGCKTNADINTMKTEYTYCPAGNINTSLRWREPGQRTHAYIHTYILQSTCLPTYSTYIPWHKHTYIHTLHTVRHTAEQLL